MVNKVSGVNFVVVLADGSHSAAEIWYRDFSFPIPLIFPPPIPFILILLLSGKRDPRALVCKFRGLLYSYGRASDRGIEAYRPETRSTRSPVTTRRRVPSRQSKKRA